MNNNATKLNFFCFLLFILSLYPMDKTYDGEEAADKPLLAGRDEELDGGGGGAADFLKPEEDESPRCGPLIAYEAPGVEITEEAAGIAGSCADALLAGRDIPEDFKRDFKNHSKEIKEFLTQNLPILVIPPEYGGISRREKAQALYILEKPKEGADLEVAVDLLDRAVDQVGRIAVRYNEECSATYEDKDGSDTHKMPRRGLQIQMWANNDMHGRGNKKDLSVSDVFIKSLAIDPNTGLVALGYDTGTISLIDAEKQIEPINQETGIQLRNYHQLPVIAMAFLNHIRNNRIVARSEDSTFIWNVATEPPRPLVKLDVSEYSKLYIIDCRAVFSHVTKSMLLSALDGDGNIELPIAWLKGYSPTNLQQAFYIWEMMKLGKLQAPVSPAFTDRIRLLYTHPIVNLFEPTVTVLFKRYIAQQARRLGIRIR